MRLPFFASPPVNDRLLTHDVRQAEERLRELGAWYVSRPRGSADEEEDCDRLVAADRDLAQAARTARIAMLSEVERRAGPFPASMLEALLEVPRERFTRARDLGESAVDVPLLLDDEGLATVSAPHAYLLSFRLLGLQPGDRLAELGTGSGYGAALASHIVGPSGAVYSVEIDERLAARAARLLAPYHNVTTACGEASELASAWGYFPRIVVTFAVDEVPPSWTDRLPEGGKMVVPVGGGDRQRLVLIERRGGELTSSDHGAVRYVPNRQAEARP